MGKQSNAPDPYEAGQRQSAADREIAEYTLAANRPNISTPYGTQTWTGQPGDANYGMNISLSPAQQAALDSQFALTAGRSDIAQGLLGDAGREMQTPEGFWEGLPEVGGAPDVPTYAMPGQTGVDLSTLPDAPEGMASPEYDPRFAEAFYDRNMSLLGPRMDRDRASLDTQLRNQGLTGLSEAYQVGTGDLRDQQGEQLGRLSQDSVMQGAMEQQREFGRQLQSGQFGEAQRGLRLGEQKGVVDEAFRAAEFQNQNQNQEFAQNMQQSTFQNLLRQQGIAEQLQREGWSLNKINALINGQQIGMPQMPDFKSAQQYQSPDYLRAATSMDANDAAQNAGMWQALGSLGGGLLGGPAGAAAGGFVGGLFG